MPTVRYTTVNGEVLSELRSGTKRDYVPDPLGSTVALLDNTQTKTDTFAYWPYGEVASRTGITATPFQFVGTAGYYRDSASRTYVRARYLHTQQGRWMTQDSIEFDSEDWNLYRYVSNSPASYRDLTGKEKNTKDCLGFSDLPGRQSSCPSVVTEAVKKVCETIQQIGVERIVQSGCISRKQALCLKEWCRYRRVVCFASGSSSCKDSCGFSCNVIGASHPGWGIALCLPSAITGHCRRGTCKDPYLAILHEMIGVCGSPHEGGDSDYPDPCDQKANCLCGNVLYPLT